jgi:hypothetical protein
MKAQLRYESSDGGGEALPGKEKTAAKGDTLTAVFLLNINFQSISLSSLDTEVNRWADLDFYPIRFIENIFTYLF